MSQYIKGIALFASLQITGFGLSYYKIEKMKK